MDRVGIGLELLAIFGKCERGTPLQFFEGISLFHSSKTDCRRFSAL
jgi:hypothetical protein